MAESAELRTIRTPIPARMDHLPMPTSGPPSYLPEASGSVSEQLARHTPYPVLVVPAERRRTSSSETGR